MAEFASRTSLSAPTAPATGIGTLPTVYWSPPVKITMLATPCWKPGVFGASTNTGRVAPTPYTRTASGIRMLFVMR